jgi:cyanophycin synthetase
MAEPLLSPDLKGLAIQSLRLLHGANYFSWEPVVWMVLDLGRYDEVFSNELDGFGPRLQQTLPSLHDHFCSPGVPGGFLKRVAEGTLLGHVIEHVAIELQQLAGITVNFGKTRSTATQGVYNVLFEFRDEQAGLFAARAAVALVDTLAAGGDFDAADAIAELVRIREERLLGPSTQAVVDAATARGIPWMRLDEQNLVQLGTGRFQRRIRATLTSQTGLIAYETALDKHLSLTLLADAAVPVPAQLCSAEDEPIEAFFRRLGGPVAVKPRQGVLGQGVSVGVGDEAGLKRAIADARRHHAEVIVQRCVAGAAFRLLTIGHKLAAAARLDPPQVTGDGAQSIAALAASLNDDPRRAIGDKGVLSPAKLDETSLRLFASLGFGPDSVPAAGQIVPLQLSGAMKLGGAATDVTDLVHTETRHLIERASRVIGLDVAGFDVICADIAQPLAPQGGAVIEVGAAPDFRPHLSPTEGIRREVGALLVASLFPKNEPDHAFTLSVTGVGATQAAHWLAACLAQAGRHVALASKRGMFAGGETLTAADASQPEFARVALRDPDANHIVLETELSGILRGGLGYGLADIGIVLNFHPSPQTGDAVRLDHPEDQAYAQSVVAEQVRPAGMAILNADQHMVSEVRQRLQSKALWFTRSDMNRTVRSSLRRDGRAIILDQGQVLLAHGRRPAVPLFPLADFVAEEAPSEEVDIVLAIAGALVALNFAPSEIADSLRASR